MPDHRLGALLGRALAGRLADLAWNRDARVVITEHQARSAGAQSALGKRPAQGSVFTPVLWHLADRIGARWSVSIGADELARGVVRLRDLDSGSEEELGQEALAARLGA